MPPPLYPRIVATLAMQHHCILAPSSLPCTIGAPHHYCTTSSPSWSRDTIVIMALQCCHGHSLTLLLLQSYKATTCNKVVITFMGSLMLLWSPWYGINIHGLPMLEINWYPYWKQQQPCYLTIVRTVIACIAGDVAPSHLVINRNWLISSCNYNKLSIIAPNAWVYKVETYDPWGGKSSAYHKWSLEVLTINYIRWNFFTWGGFLLHVDLTSPCV